MALPRTAIRTFHVNPQDWRNLKGEIAERLALQAVFAELPLGNAVGGAYAVRKGNHWYLNHIAHRRKRHERWHFENGWLNVQRDVPRQELRDEFRKKCKGLVALDPRTPAAKAALRRLEKLSDEKVLRRLQEAVIAGKRDYDAWMETDEDDELTPEISVEQVTRRLGRLEPKEKRMLLSWRSSLACNLYDGASRAILEKPRGRFDVMDFVPDLRRSDIDNLTSAYKFIDRQLELVQAGLDVMEHARPDYVVYEYDGDLRHIYFFEVKSGSSQLNKGQARAAERANGVPGITFKVLYLPLPDLVIPMSFQSYVHGGMPTGDTEHVFQRRRYGPAKPPLRLPEVDPPRIPDE